MTEATQGTTEQARRLFGNKYASARREDPTVGVRIDQQLDYAAVSFDDDRIGSARFSFDSSTWRFTWIADERFREMDGYCYETLDLIGYNVEAIVDESQPEQQSYVGVVALDVNEQQWEDERSGAAA